MTNRSMRIRFYFLANVGILITSAVAMVTMSGWFIVPLFSSALGAAMAWEHSAWSGRRS